MNNIKILDCTLRDGGYVNNWLFGAKNIALLINALDNSRADFIECGFLTKETYCNNAFSADNKSSNNYSLFNSFEEINEILPSCINKEKIAAMISIGKFSIDKIPDYSSKYIKNLRVIFKKQNLEHAADFCIKLKGKGYNVFINPTFIQQYNNIEFERLLKSVNNINPYAFTIVDSTGALDSSSFTKLLYSVDKALNSGIKLGFHFHNNLENAFMNAEILLKLIGKRNCIIDSSLYGMGRGAGNLQTELLMHFLNGAHGGIYNPVSLANVINEIIKRFYNQSPWIASIPYNLAALYNCHPDYAKFFVQKGFVDTEKVNRIFQALPHDKKDIYTEEIIENMWHKF